MKTALAANLWSMGQTLGVALDMKYLNNEVLFGNMFENSLLLLNTKIVFQKEKLSMEHFSNNKT